MQPIFSRNSDFRKIAFLNWRIEQESQIFNLLNIADGYVRSALELVNHCLEENEDYRADILIFPVLNNVNHGLELYLKAILWMLNKLSGVETKIEGRHNIKQIFETVRARVKERRGEPTLQDFDNATIELKDYLVELVEKINSTPKNDKMDFSRYPFSNSYEDHFYIGVLGNVEVDLENFISRFTIIHKQLKLLSEFLYFHELG